MDQSEDLIKEIRILQSLEKIRNTTMDMEDSGNLKKVVGLLNDEISQFQLAEWGCNIQIMHDQREEIEIWLSGSDNKIFDQSFFFKEAGHPVIKKQWEQWGNKSDTFHISLSGTKKESYDNFLFEYTDFKHFPETLKKQIKSQKQVHFSFARMKYGNLVSINESGVLSKVQLDILKRFAKVFEQAYTRFLDFKKLEEQTREAQIEAALERVRAASMAMHEPAELTQVVNVLMQQIENLAIDCYSSMIIIPDETGFSSQIWMSNDWRSDFHNPLHFPMDNRLKWSKEWRKAWENNHPIFQYKIEGKSLDRFFNHMFTNTDFVYVPEEVKSATLEKKQIYNTTAFCSNAGLMVNSDNALDKKSKNILIRFAKVFEQSYTRFLDLQKAEKQAQEAKIEAAMERVRAASMAMHKSEDIVVVGNVLYQEFISLGITQSATCGFVIIDEKDQVQHLYGSSAGKSFLEYFELPLLGDTILKNRYEAWKRKEPVFQQVLGGNQLKKHLEVVMPLENLTEEIRLSQLEMPDPSNFYFGNFSQGYLQVIADAELLDDQVDLIPRFAKVFQQTYTRFLDLKKAEVQARESQIEAALERVRAAGMAMHHTYEFSDVAMVLFDQLKTLGIDSQWCWFAIVNDKEQYTDIWYTEYGGKFNPTPSRQSFNDPEARGFVKAWREKEPFYTYQLKGKSLAQYIDILGTDPEFKKTSSYGIMMENIKGCLKVNHSFFKYGALGFSTFTQCDMDILPLLGRFAKTFEQTYTRFLDLQKAEAQAREAQIEAALERVRAQSLAMHHTSELQQVINTVGVEFQTLNINNSGGVFISINEEIQDIISCWGSGGTADYMEKVDIPFFDQPIYTNIIHSIKKGPGFVTEAFSNKEKVLFFKHMFEYPPYVNTTKEHRKKFLEKPGGYTRSCVISNHTTLFMINHEGYTFTDEENDVIKRFGRVFEQSYTRFLDLQRAEAQAREAQIEAALEKVRSASMGMAQSDELARVVSVLFEQFKSLNLPISSSWIGVLDDSEEHMEMWFTGLDETIIIPQKFLLPLKGNKELERIVTSWKSKEESFKHTFKGKDARVWIQQLYEITGSPAFAHSESIDLIENIFGFHQYGNVGISSQVLIQEEAHHILLRFTKAFEQAYTRFLDLQKAEEQSRLIKEEKLQLEKTLTELRATQTQLIQSEKMASLGELTAGIAHEIQNPLNFVNNFSEVSYEIIDEAIEELEAGDHEEAQAILQDLKSNLEKISHHGHRASSIVRSMLDHSRSSSGEKVPTDLNALCDEYLRLAYHGMRARDRSFNAAMETNFDESLPEMNVVPQDIGRVLLNLINNAFQAVLESPDLTGLADKKNKVATGHSNSRDKSYTSDLAGLQPKVEVTTKNLGDAIEITVTDNGPGIPEDIRNKIFQPFFTTKPTGQGTGLGLSLSYDIIKAHEGELSVESSPGEGTAFTITLPITSI